MAGMVVFGCISVVTAIMLMGMTVNADSSANQEHKVTVLVDGGEWEYASTASTVSGVLKDAGITVGEKDEVYPTVNTKPYDKMRIRVVRVTQKTFTAKEPVEFKTVTRFDPFFVGSSAVRRKGVKGEKEVKYLQVFRDGAKSSEQVVETRIIKKPVSEIKVLTRSSFLASRSGSYTNSFQMIATAYDPGPRGCGPRATGRTATGMRARRGIAAVDPRIIPLGTKLYVEGYGFCIAADTGGAIKGSRIDLCFESYDEARRYGRHRVMVYILEPGTATEE